MSNQTELPVSQVSVINQYIWITIPSTLAKNLQLNKSSIHSFTSVTYKKSVWNNAHY